MRFAWQLISQLTYALQPDSDKLREFLDILMDPMLRVIAEMNRRSGAMGPRVAEDRAGRVQGNHSPGALHDGECGGASCAR